MEVSKNLWATCNTDFGRIKSAEPLKIQTDIIKSLPKLPDIHSSLSPHRPRSHSRRPDHQGLISPRTSPSTHFSGQSGNLTCWMAICPGLESCNKTLIPHFQVCSNSNPFLSPAVNHLESVQTFQHSIGPPRPIFTFTWEHQQHTWTAMAHGITGDPPCFSHVLHQDLRPPHPLTPSKLTLFKYVGNLLLCSIIKEASITDSIYLLQQLAEKRQCLQGGKNQ